MTVSVTPEPGPDWLQRNLFWVARTSVLSYVLVGLSLIAAIGTYLILTGSTPIDPEPNVLWYLGFVDALLLVALAALVIGRLVQVWMARRSGTAGARLHGRLVTIFGLIAVIPVVLTAGAAGVTTQLAMESWFGEPVQRALDNSVAVAKSYLAEHTDKIRNELLFAQLNLNSLNPLAIEANPVRFQETLNEIAKQVRAEIAIFDSEKNEFARANPDPMNQINAPRGIEMDDARDPQRDMTPTVESGQIRGVARLNIQFEFGKEYFIVVQRRVNPQIIEYQQNTEDVVKRYNQLKITRDEGVLAFLLMFGLIAFVILFAAIWIGLGTANRIVTPIGRLIGAAERISEGDLAARVMLAADDDELASLGKAFNRMTAQLQSQRNELVESHRQAEQRRRFTEAVLSGVSAGVIGLDGQGKADVANRSGLNLLSATRDDIVGHELGAAVPEVAAIVAQAMASADGRAQAQIDIVRGGKARNLIVTVTRERATEDESGYVVTFDDVTDLISAQRTSAWADVARRIAHEIKNPLTPIQLSAERLRRKYKKEIATDPEIFEQCTQTIIRQVGDIGRMVDEFSSFARMPQPVMRDEDICELIKHAVFLQRVALPQVTFALLTPEVATMVECDGRLVSQALTNVLKNATESVRARFGIEGEEGQLKEGGRIEIRLVEEASRVAIEIIDNGIGLPTEDRNRLTEPYVTKRAKGTGLGLAIVKKIMEDHKGALSLEDAPKIDETGATRDHGALVRLTFPRRLGAVKLAGE
jgi:two-component system, NtrC family, nitrogen regulation sensor histidine kinase NtrY